MHVLVTGGAGFIGSHVVAHHLSLGDKAHANAMKNIRTASGAFEAYAAGASLVLRF